MVQLAKRMVFPTLVSVLRDGLVVSVRLVSFIFLIMSYRVNLYNIMRVLMLLSQAADQVLVKLAVVR